MRKIAAGVVAGLLLAGCSSTSDEPTNAELLEACIDLRETEFDNEHDVAVEACEEAIANDDAEALELVREYMDRQNP